MIRFFSGNLRLKRKNISMKKLLFIVLIGFFSLNVHAQNDPAPAPSMEDAMQEMMKLFGGMDSLFGDDMMMDTVIIKQFGNMDDLGLGDMFQMNPQDMDALFKQLEEQMQQFNGGGFGDLEELLEQFGMSPGSAIPAPDQLPDGDQPADEKKKPKKKRKTYSM